MAEIVALGLEHWIITGWIVIIIGLVISQNEDVINASVNSKNSSYDFWVTALVYVGFGWLCVTLIAVVKFIWFNV